GLFGFFFSSRRRHTSFSRDWSSDVCSSDLGLLGAGPRLLVKPPVDEHRRRGVGVFRVGLDYLAPEARQGTGDVAVGLLGKGKARSEERRVGQGGEGAG